MLVFIYRLLLHFMQNVVRKVYRALTEADDSYGWNQKYVFIYYATIIVNVGMLFTFRAKYYMYVSLLQGNFPQPCKPRNYTETCFRLQSAVTRHSICPYQRYDNGTLCAHASVYLDNCISEFRRCKDVLC